MAKAAIKKIHIYYNKPSTLKYFLKVTFSVVPNPLIPKIQLVWWKCRYNNWHMSINGVSSMYESMIKKRHS